MNCTNEGKNFAFIGLHKTKTTCFALEEVTFPMEFYPLFQTKTSCFGHKIMITSCHNDDYLMLGRYRKLEEDSRFQRRKIEDNTLSATIMQQNSCHLSPSISFYLPLSTRQASLQKLNT